MRKNTVGVDPDDLDLNRAILRLFEITAPSATVTAAPATVMEVPEAAVTFLSTKLLEIRQLLLGV